MTRSTRLLVVVEHTISPERTGADDVPIGKDVAQLGIDDKSGGLAGESRLGIERASLTEADGDDIPDDRFDGSLPLCRIGQGGDGEEPLLFLSEGELVKDGRIGVAHHVNLAARVVV